MSNSKFYFLLATGSLIIILLFACKRKTDTGKTPGGGIITENSFYLQNFVIQDAADARVLDFQDVHRIAQASVENVGKGAVDTIYFSVLKNVDRTSLKLKPRFYDPERVTTIEADTSKVRDFTNNGVDYPKMKVTFNTGLVRTFAIVSTEATPSQDNINLLLNQNIYYISQYKISNGVSDILSTPISLKNHTPIFKQTSIKDTIELSVTTDDIGAVNSSVIFTPSKYGQDNTDTVVAQINPATLSFDKNTESDVWKTMIITFSSGFTREYAVKVLVVDPNVALNRDKYYINTYKLTDKNGAIATSNYTQNHISYNIPENPFSQQDTIIITLESAEYNSYPVTFTPDRWGTTSDANNTIVVTPTTGLTIQRADTGKHLPYTITFPNGFKREYQIVIHQKPGVTGTIDFGSFNVLPAGATVSYAQIKDSSIVSDPKTAFLTDSSILIVRPLSGWTGGRNVTLEFTDLEPEVTGTLSLYAGNTLGDNVSSTPIVTQTNGTLTIPINFATINCDSIKLTLANTLSGGKSKNYKIKLLTGFRKKPVVIVDGTAMRNVYINDTALKVAVSDNYVYVLKIKRTSGSNGSLNNVDWQSATYEIDVFNITTSAPTAPAFTMGTNGNLITDIVCFNNVLYGIAMVPTATSGTAVTNKYQIFKWTNTTSSTDLPEAFSGATAGTTAATTILPLFTANIDAGSINFYSILQSGGTGMKNPQVFQISASMSGSSATPAILTPKQAWNNTTATNGSSLGYATYLDIPNWDRGIFVKTIATGESFLTANKKFANALGNCTNKYFTFYVEGTSSFMPLGANIDSLRDNYYFIHQASISNTATNTPHRMYVIDLGKKPGDVFDVLTSPSELYNRSVYMSPSATNALASTLVNSRGNCRSYRLSDGSKIRIVSLVANNGFKVWDMQ